MKCHLVPLVGRVSFLFVNAFVPVTPLVGQDNWWGRHSAIAQTFNSRMQDSALVGRAAYSQYLRCEPQRRRDGQ
ncbi:hypothetical protein V8C43DRAFT_290414 [Trichoderma afarasin]